MTKNESPKQELLTTREVSAITGIKESTYRKAVSSKTGLAADLAHVQLGSRIFYRPEDVMAWIEKHVIRPDESSKVGA